MNTIKEMRKLAIIWGILTFLITTMLITISLVYKNKIVKYDQLLDKLDQAARLYIEDKSLYPLANEQIKVTLTELTDNSNINFKIGDKNCDGYVLVSYRDNVFRYDPYLRCPGYTSKDYNKY